MEGQERSNKEQRNVSKDRKRNDRKMKKSERHVNYFVDFMTRHKKTIGTCTAFLVILASVLYYGSLHKFSKPPNITKKLTTVTKPYISNHILINQQILKQALYNLQAKQQQMENNIETLLKKLENLHVTTKQYGGFVNLKQVKMLIQEALQVHDRDQLGIEDYALESIGGRILSIPETSPAPTYFIDIFGLLKFQLYSRPTELIKPDVNPGKCFGFLGTRGRIQIELTETIYITSVTLEHTDKLLVGKEIGSAPKTFIVYGFNNHYNISLVELGTYKYSIEGPTRQTFNIAKENQTTAFRFVELAILDNHGKEKFTCVYRFRVHGKSA